MAQLCWELLKQATTASDKNNNSLVARYEPWSLDAMAASAGLVTWLLQKQQLVPQNDVVLPHAFLALALLKTTHVVFHQFQEEGKKSHQHHHHHHLHSNGDNDDDDDDEESVAVFTLSIVSTAATFWALHVQNIPVSLVAMSVSGALLAYDSMRAEITSNWFYLLQIAGKFGLKIAHAGRKTVRPAIHLVRKVKKVKDAMYAKLEQAELHHPLVWLAARVVSIRNQVSQFVDTAKETIRNLSAVRAGLKLMKRIEKSLRPVVIPWSIAILGVAVQMGKIYSPKDAMQLLKVTFNPVHSILKRAEKAEKTRVKKVGQSLLTDIDKKISMTSGRKNATPSPSRAEKK